MTRSRLDELTERARKTLARTGQPQAVETVPGLPPLPPVPALPGVPVRPRRDEERPRRQVVLGIDPGIGTTGYAIVRSLPGHSGESGLDQLFFGKNVTTAVVVGQARGVALLAVAEAGLPVSEYKPAEIKQTVAGFGRADKAQLQRMVQRLLSLDDVPRPDDAADALAIAICHLRYSRARAMGLR